MHLDIEEGKSTKLKMYWQHVILMCDLHKFDLDRKGMPLTQE